MKTFKLIALLALASAWVMPAGAQAQADASYPSRPVRFIVPMGPGSGADAIVRAFAEQLRIVSGQPTFVENKAGADLIIGTQNLVNSPADGYSVLFVSNSSLVVNPLLVKDLPYKANELAPMMDLTRTPAVLVTAPGSRFKSLAELLDAARKDPGGVSIGVYSNGYRLGALDLGRQSGTRFNLIPYKGATQALGDVLGGTTDAMFIDVVTATTQVNAGKLRALAVAADKRHAKLPAVPTASEGGVPGYALYVISGLAIHAKTPPAISHKLEALMSQVMAKSEVRDILERATGAEISGGDRESFAKMIAAERERVQELVRVYGPNLLQ